MSTDTKPTVQEALAAITAELPNIGKDDRSPEGYSYRGVEAVTRHLQPLLAKHGVVIVPKAEVLATVPSPAMKDGWQDVIMRVDWTIYGPDGSHIDATTNGVGRDRSDKGANKAQTQAFKYLVLHLFCIADGKDDADGLTYEHDRQEAPRLRPGELFAKDAKDRLLAFVEGDKDAAKTAWTAAGLDGRMVVTEEELGAALLASKAPADDPAPDATQVPAGVDIVAELEHLNAQLGDLQKRALDGWFEKQDQLPDGNYSRAVVLAAIKKARELRSHTGPIDTSDEAEVTAP